MPNQTEKTKPQIDKFRETARELEADESEQNFVRNLKKIVTPNTKIESKDSQS